MARVGNLEQHIVLATHHALLPVIFGMGGCLLQPILAILHTGIPVHLVLRYQEQPVTNPPPALLVVRIIRG
jgi:hypothetical protein